MLANSYPEYSRSALVKLFDMQKITLNNEPIRPGDKIKAGDSFLADISELQKPAEDIDLPIIYEDESIIVIDKPAGIISHARGKYWDEPSVASFIRQQVSFDSQNERAGIVHRLDRATSGVIVCAKNTDALSYLQKQFGNRKVEKKYTAIINGNINPAEAIINLPIARNPKKPQTMIIKSGGKASETAYRTVKNGNKYSLLELSPKTGRTHQLRVHLNYLSKPIVGDLLYGGEPAERLFLHAHSLKLVIPSTGEQKIFEAKLPAIFNKKLTE